MITVNDTYCIFKSCKKVDLKSSNHKKSVQLHEVMDVNCGSLSVCVYDHYVVHAKVMQSYISIIS